MNTIYTSTEQKVSITIRRITIAAAVGLCIVALLFVATRAGAASTDPISLWDGSASPSTIDTGDPGSLELGMKFQSSVTGKVTGVKFYKSDANSGTHVGNLWSSTGSNLASVTFTGESASGWQSATFASPVQITANTTYVISYFAPQGRFSKDAGYFSASARTVGPLTGLQDGTDGANGVYVYTGSSAFPANPSSSDNYWVDVVFTPDAVTAPVNVAAVQNKSAIDLTWSPGTNASEVTQYQVFRNGSQVATVGGAVFQYSDMDNLQLNGSYTYTLKAVDGATTTGDSNSSTVQYVTAHESVKVIDSANTINDPAWFTQAYADGFRLYVMHSTAWGTCTPWYNTQAQLGMALDAGLKIAVYTRDPNCWNAGILATGPYQDKLQFFALDSESDPGVPVTREMVDGVKAMNVRPVIYTGSGMWNGIQGATANDFADIPLWDTNTSAFDYTAWQANYLAPAPFAYGGWNTPTTMRVGVQQQFEYDLNGVKVDLNSFDASFLTVGEPVAVPPSGPATDAPLVTQDSSGGVVASSPSRTVARASTPLSSDANTEVNNSASVDASTATTPTTTTPATATSLPVTEPNQKNAYIGPIVIAGAVIALVGGGAVAVVRLRR